MLESLFNKVALKLFIKKKLQDRHIPVNIAKFLSAAFLRTPVAAFDLPLIYTFELIAFSSRAMS